MKRLLPLAVLLAGARAQDAPLALFNGKDLTGFYTYLKPHGKNIDPNKVFTVADGVIRVSGQDFGYFATEKEYENYHLTVEFKWGRETFAPRLDKARDSGLLFHMVGEDKVWPKSHEFQIMEGMTGELILVGGCSVDYDEAFKGRLRNPKGLSPDGKRIVSGGVKFFGRTDDFKDVLGYRGPRDLEKPVGEWNVLELICDGTSYTYIVNGTKALACSGADPAKGRIVLQSEGAELFFRKIELRPLKK
jgi:hypothetical protein